MRNTNYNGRFIPINDDVNKLVAFAPSLTKDWRDNQRISSKSYQIETMDALVSLRKEGWKISGVNQATDKYRRIKEHTVKLNHPDFSMRNGNAKEGIAEMRLQNSCNGKSPLTMDLGMFRQVCSNGLMAFDTIEAAHTKIRHTEADYKQLEGILCSMNIKTEGVLQEFAKLKERELSPQEVIEMVGQASNLRFKGIAFDTNQLLTVRRKEDEGNNLWSVYNRIQENLTQQNMLFDNAGNAINIALSVNDDIEVNKKLFQLVHAYA